MKQEIINIINKFLNNESIAYDLIQYFEQDDFENEIVELADRAVNDSFSAQLPLERKALVVVAITVIAIRYYDGNLWDHIRDLFVNAYNGDHDQKADSKIRSMLQQFKKDCNYSDNESLVAVPLIAAGVTHYWLQSFFDFCFAIYKANLLYRRDIEDTELKSELFNTFQAMKVGNHLSDKEDIIRIGQSQSYKLSKYTQSALLTGTNLDGISSIGTYCIKSIVKCLNGESFRIHPYYKDAFNSWKEHFYSNKAERNKLTDSGNWKISIKLKNDNFYLISKTEKIPESANPDNVELQLLEDGVVKYTTKDLTINFAIGGYLVSSKMVAIPFSILNKLSYRLVDGDNILFESGDKIYKNNDVFFFDKEGNQINSNSDYDGVLTIVTRNEIKPEHTKFQKNDYFVSELNVNPSGSYTFDGKIYSFKTIRKAGIDGDVASGILVHTNIDGLDYELFTSVNSVLIETRHDKNDLYLSIDGEIIDLFDSVDYPVLDNGIRQYKILMPSLKKGWHVVSVNLKANCKPVSKCSFAFAFDSNFSKSIKMKENGIYELHIISAFVTDIKEITGGVTNVDFPCVVQGRGMGALKINPEIILTNFGSKWINNDERIRFSSLNNLSPLIRLTGSKGMIARATTSKTVIDLLIVANKEIKGEYLLDIGPALALKNSDVPYVKINIENENSSYSIYLDFVTFIDISKSVVKYDPLTDTSSFSFVYDEEKEVTCSIIENPYNTNVFTQVIHSGLMFFLQSLKPFVSYKIVLSEKGDGMFAKDKTICELPYFFANSRDLVGHVFDIDTVEIYNENDQLIKRYVGSNGTTLKIFDVNKDDKNSFVGKLRRIEYGYDQLNKLGLLKISTDSEFEGDKIWIYICDLKDEDLLLYDNNDKKICWTNQITHETKKFPGIERYLIKVR